MIAIITDSDASLTDSLAEKYGITQVPITIQFGEEVFRSGVDMNDDELFVRIDREGKLPTTAAPSPGNFTAAYQSAFDHGADAVICLCVSGEISATYNSAKLAAEEFHAHKRIEVVDTRNLTMGQGYMAIAAAEAVQAGASVEEAVAAAHHIGERVHVYGALATLKYLALSGRVSHLAAGMAGMLDIKPILSVQNGKLDLLEKIRTRKKAWARVVELTQLDLNGRAIERMCVVHVAAAADAEEFKKLLIEQLDYSGFLPVLPLSAGLAVHTGAGLVGLVFVVGE